MKRLQRLLNTSAHSRAHTRQYLWRQQDSTSLLFNKVWMAVIMTQWLWRWSVIALGGGGTEMRGIRGALLSVIIHMCRSQSHTIESDLMKLRHLSRTSLIGSWSRPVLFHFLIKVRRPARDLQERGGALFLLDLSHSFLKFLFYTNVFSKIKQRLQHF